MQAGIKNRELFKRAQSRKRKRRLKKFRARERHLRNNGRRGKS